MFQRLAKSLAGAAGRTSAPGGAVKGAQAQYLEGLRDRRTGRLLMPHVSLRTSKDDVGSSWKTSTALAVRALQNSPWIAGAVDQTVALIVGDELRASVKADFSWAGWDDQRSAEWSRAAEKLFAQWARDPQECDAAGRHTLGQLQAAAVSMWFATGEAFAQVVEIDDRPGARFATKLRLVPSWTVDLETKASEQLVQGVYLDSHAAPIGYRLKWTDLNGSQRTEDVAARDGFGRPRMVHAFDGLPDQVRGMTVFAPALKAVRDFDQLANATMTATTLQTILAATVKSDYPSADVLSALQSEDEIVQGEQSPFDAFMAAKMGWANNTDIDLQNHGKIAHLMMGERLEFHGAKTPHNNYEAFANFLLREIARCIGINTTDLTGDYRQSSYSAIRMANANKWPIITRRRRNVPGAISQAVLSAFLEEAIDQDLLQVPGGMDAFIANRGAICRADWIGPPKPQADDQKAAEAHRIYREMGVISDETICADLGVDVDDVYRARAREQGLRDTLGIHGGVTNGGSDVDAMPDSETATGDDAQ